LKIGQYLVKLRHIKAVQKRVSVFLDHPVCLELLYGPYHSPTLGDTLLVTVDVTNDAANGQLGFDDVTVPLAPPPTATEASQLTVS